MKPSKQSMVIYILIAVVVILAGYIAYDKIIVSYNQKVTLALQQGYQAGASDALKAIYQQTSNCQIATITLANATRSLADLECVQQALAQQQQETETTTRQTTAGR